MLAHIAADERDRERETTMRAYGASPSVSFGPYDLHDDHTPHANSAPRASRERKKEGTFPLRASNGTCDWKIVAFSALAVANWNGKLSRDDAGARVRACVNACDPSTAPGRSTRAEFIVKKANRKEEGEEEGEKVASRS